MPQPNELQLGTLTVTECIDLCSHVLNLIDNTETVVTPDTISEAWHTLFQVRHAMEVYRGDYGKCKGANHAE